jgi:monoamine oxidase
MTTKGVVGGRLSRRNFLKLLGATGALAATGCGGAGATGGGRQVVVLGGGLAGLSSAYELRKRGYEVVAVLEAQKRPGGRVLTLRDPFMNGQYAEAGATRIPDDHHFTLSYADEFGLSLREFVTSEPAQYFVKGKKFIHDDGQPWPADVFDFAQAQGTTGADSVVLGYEKLDELGDPLQTSWPTGKGLEYDGLTIEQYLKQNGASDDVVLLDRCINGTELSHDDALYWLMADVVDAAWDKTWAIAGGNDQLPKAFAASLGDIVKYGCSVTALQQDAGSVSVRYTQDGVERTISADLAVCGLPFSILRKIDTSGAQLSAEKQAAIAGVSYMPVSRCYLQTKTRFWTQAPYSVGGLKVARTDTAIERLWDVTKVQDGESGILLSYLMAENGLAFQAQPATQRIDYVKAGIRAFWPEIDDQFLVGTYKIWQEDPFVGGAWGYYQPGTMGALFPAAKKPEGRIFFCGEHTSAWSGWMQGAFESANRVVAEMT